MTCKMGNKLRGWGDGAGGVGGDGRGDGRGDGGMHHGCSAQRSAVCHTLAGWTLGN